MPSPTFAEPADPDAATEAAPDRSGRLARLSELVAEIAALEQLSHTDQKGRWPTAGSLGSAKADTGSSDRSGGDAASGGAASDDAESDGRAGAKVEAKAKDICLRMLTGAPRSRGELAAALKRKEIEAEVAERVLDRLEVVGLIDDAAYANAFVTAKHRDRGLTRSALSAELRKRGIDRELAADAVSQVDEEAEVGRARQLLDKRIDAAMGAGEVAARRRLLGLLSRRGYPSQLAYKAVDAAITAYLAEST